MSKDLYLPFLNLEIKFVLNKIYILTAFFLFFVACSQQKPHPRQYLINRHFIYSSGLQQYIELYDLAIHNPIKAIHIGKNDEDTIVYNYMLYDKNCDLKEINGIVEEEVGNLLTFRYDKNKVLRSIKHNKTLLPLLDYDSIILEYKGATPKKAKLMKQNRAHKEINIAFDDQIEEYIFTPQSKNRGGNLFDIYLFRRNRLMAEYHKITGNKHEIDSTNYYYSNNLLAKQTNHLHNNSMLLITDYKNGTPNKTTAIDSKNKSVLWVDKYEYNTGEVFPKAIFTTSPLGWKQYFYYFIENKKSRTL